MTTRTYPLTADVEAVIQAALACYISDSQRCLSPDVAALFPQETRDLATAIGTAVNLMALLDRDDFQLRIAVSDDMWGPWSDDDCAKLLTALFGEMVSR